MAFDRVAEIKQLLNQDDAREGQCGVGMKQARRTRCGSRPGTDDPHRPMQSTPSLRGLRRGADWTYIREGGCRRDPALAEDQSVEQ
jgi:hypothetical protein